MPRILNTLLKTAKRTVATHVEKRREEGFIFISEILAALGIGFGAIISIVTPAKGIWLGFILMLSIAFALITRDMPITKTLPLLFVVTLNAGVIACSTVQALDFLFGLNFIGDWRYLLPRKKADFKESVQLVVIDQRTRETLGPELGRYGGHHSKIIDHLAIAGVPVIVFDMNIAEDSEFDAAHITSTNDITKPRILTPDRYDFHTGTFSSRLENPEVVIEPGKNAWHRRTHNELAVAADDGVVRSAALKMDQDHLAIAFAAYLSFIGAEMVFCKEHIKYRTGDGEVETLPLNKGGLNINYSGESIEPISYLDIYSNNFEKAQFDGRIVLIGDDSKVNVPGFPTSRMMSTIEVHANVIGTLMTKAYIRKLSRGSYAVLILMVMTINLNWFIKHMKSQRATRPFLKRFVHQTVILTIISILAQSFFNLWIELSYPLAAIWLSYFSFRLCQRHFGTTVSPETGKYVYVSK